MNAATRAIRSVEILQVDLAPKVVRTDAIQSFVTQETPIVRLRCDDGTEGIGYTYTIGTGGSSVVALLRDHLAPRLLGRDPDQIEAIWKALFFATHATAVGAITSLALAAIDTGAVGFEMPSRRTSAVESAGGAQPRVPVYTTEGGWLQLSVTTLVEQTVAAKAQGFRGAKLKVGKPHVSEEVARIKAVREAVGDDFELMVDANQCFNVSEAIRRARAFEPFGLAWLEEPLPAEDLSGHVELAAHSAIPIAIGESLYHPSHFREYLERDACTIVQVDCARIGGITPWLKVAHLGGDVQRRRVSRIS
jgi:L-alanine-DL-glutamate epimerase-like enolase superfamily enzyme